ncbi:AI-2E family transporter [Mobilicoccus pelagius]|uniref:AI-2E family transporter n=1 Tax=Mobilicoccus pelagius NBRC 104925 TaxID=1089455 RepID=H5USP7_9MICO|nr:AI-2E family transporter [Mobilicoccus pelagius]GAB48755.1 hypothetical protein MOPEL_080_00340 [Mobilicoccus pelagius NBRC 104925]
MSVPHPPRQRPTSTWIDPRHLPYPLVVAGAWSGRLVLVLAAAALLLYGLAKISFIVVPLAIALLFAVLLHPLHRFLRTKAHLPDGLSAGLSLILLIALVTGSVSLAGTQIATGVEDMRSSVSQGIDSFIAWLSTGPLHLTTTQLQDYVDRAREALQKNSSNLTSGALAASSSAVDFLAGTLIALFTTFFFLYQGEKIYRFVLHLLPEAAQDPTFQALRRGWVSLGAYARTQVIVAGVDALGISLGALVLGLPFVVPLFLLVFIASFVPIVGAFVSGAVAVLIAFVVKGPVVALVMLGVVLVVQQLESHVLQPFLMGKAVALHPLAVVLAVAVGSYLLGIVGALFAVPVLAVVNSATRYLVGDDPFPELGDGPLPPTAGQDVDHELPATVDDADARTDAHTSTGTAATDREVGGSHTVTD